MLVLIRLRSLKNHSVLWRPLKLSPSVLLVEDMSLPSYSRGKGCAERVRASAGQGAPFTFCAMVTLLLT